MTGRVAMRARVRLLVLVMVLLVLVLLQLLLLLHEPLIVQLLLHRNAERHQRAQWQRC